MKSKISEGTKKVLRKMIAELEGAEENQNIEEKTKRLRLSPLTKEKLKEMVEEIKKDGKCKDQDYTVEIEEALKKIEPKLEQIVSKSIREWLGYSSTEWIDKMYR